MRPRDAGSLVAMALNLQRRTSFHEPWRIAQLQYRQAEARLLSGGVSGKR
jgi:hypothetical protein